MLHRNISTELKGKVGPGKPPRNRIIRFPYIFAIVFTLTLMIKGRFGTVHVIICRT